MQLMKRCKHCLAALLTLVSVSSCVSNPNSAELRSGDKRSVAKLIATHGEIVDPVVKKYLKQLSNTLLTVSPEEFYRQISDTRTFNIIVLASMKPVAQTAGNGTTILSTALISSLESEDELAFVLAHELAHNLLDHQPIRSGWLSDEAISQELNADKLGVVLAGYAGFRTLAAPDAILKLSSAEFSTAQVKSKREDHFLRARLQNLYNILPSVAPLNLSAQYRHEPSNSNFKLMQRRISQQYLGRRQHRPFQ